MGGLVVGPTTPTGKAMNLVLLGTCTVILVVVFSTRGYISTRQAGRSETRVIP